MFSQASVILFTGVVADTPLSRRPPLADTPPCPVHAGIHTPLPSACWDTPLPPPAATGMHFCYDVNMSKLNI